MARSFMSVMTVTPLIVTRVVKAQADDSFCREKIVRLLAEGGESYTVSSDGGLRFNGRLVVPEGEELRHEVMAESHGSRFAVHPGGDKMYQAMRRQYWWSGMKRDIAVFVSKCATCQLVKVDHQRPAGLLQPLEVLMWMWESISMDFITGLPTSQRGHDSIWVIMDRLTKVAHFLPVRINYTTGQYAQLFIAERVRLHGVPLNIVSDRDKIFVSRFWESFLEAMGTELRLSTAYHAQIDGQTERTN